MFKYIESEGFTDTTSWLIIYSEEWEQIRSQLSGAAGDFNPSKSYDYLLTSHHEMVHFWQAISTNFLLNYSENYLELCFEAVRKLSEGIVTTTSLEKLQALFKDSLKALTLETNSIRTIDLIEGAAVLCSYRMTNKDASYEGFSDHLNTYHVGQRIYINAYNYMVSLIGELSFDLFSPICYLSLQFREPSQAFISILEELSKFCYLHLRREGLASSIIQEAMEESPLDFLVQLIDVSKDNFLLSLVERNSIEISHPILEPYIVKASELLDECMDFFARPYYYFGVGRVNEASEFMKPFAPPLQLHADGRANIMGIGKSLGVDWSLQLLYLTAVVGIVGKIIFKKQDKMICPHANCPLFNKGICYRFYGFPLDDYSKCGFPKFLSETGLNQLVDLEY